ncbi:MAG: hypothetical protein ACLQMH_13490 [Solirubrobacteraceae bacterium]
MANPGAPLESCAGCRKGDTHTALILEGEAEWIAANLHNVTGVSVEEAEGMFEMAEAEAYAGWLSTVKPNREGMLVCPVRLCHECAAKAGMSVEVLPGPLPVIGQPDENGVDRQERGRRV